MSPTQRSLAKLRKSDWLCASVERWNPHAKIRQDLFGFIDIVAVKDNIVIGIQACVGNDTTKRIRKIVQASAAKIWLNPPNRLICVHGWRKIGPRGKRKLWDCRETYVTLNDLYGTISGSYSAHDPNLQIIHEADAVVRR